MKTLKRVMIIALFVILFVTLLVPLSYTLRPLEGENKEVRERITGFYAEEKDSLDVVMVGSSGLFRYVDTPYLWKQEGLTSYNFTFPSLSIYLIEDLIDEVHKSQSPELLVIDMRKFLFTNNKKISKVRSQFALNNVNYSPLRCRMVNRVFNDPKERISYYFDIAVYHDGWENVTLENLKYADNKEEHALKGFRIIDVARQYEPINVSGVDGMTAISGDAEEALRSLLKKCKEENLEVLFLTTPWPITEKEQKKSNYIGSIIEEYDYQYLDMNPIKDEIGIDCSTDFYEEKHVNVYGAEKVTAYLGEYIRDNYEFTRVHDESVVESWNKAAEEYDEKMKDLKK